MEIKSIIKIIRNIFIILIFSGIANTSDAQSIAFQYKGVWSPWAPICRYDIFHPNYHMTSRWDGNSLDILQQTFFGDVAGIVLKSAGGTTIFHVKINTDEIRPIDKKERKRHLKSNAWYYYKGTVEYYVNDAYPTADDLAKDCRLVIPNPRYDKSPSVKREAKCTIGIAPYKKSPEVWNIYFDDIGIAISTCGIKFKK